MSKIVPNIAKPVMRNYVFDEERSGKIPYELLCEMLLLEAERKKLLGKSRAATIAYRRVKASKKLSKLITKRDMWFKNWKRIVCCQKREFYW